MYFKGGYYHFFIFLSTPILTSFLKAIILNIEKDICETIIPLVLGVIVVYLFVK